MAKYTSLRNSQIILFLLKYRGIRKVVASPGTQNMSIVVSMQNDPFFEMYSAADERSAAYIACGLAAESSEPVVITCTGATASRNYLPALTEAYYRQLPVIALTSTEELCMIGNNIAQVIDRSTMQQDVARCSIVMQGIKDHNDEWKCVLSANKALLELNHHGRGPVHINIEKYGKEDFSFTELPVCRVIDRIMPGYKMPVIPQGARVNIFIGAHVPFTEVETAAIDSFCEKANAVVMCDHTSGYQGKYKVNFSLVATQIWNVSLQLQSDILIHLGEVSGDYALTGKLGSNAKEVWRVSEDGELKDTFRKLRFVFEMPIFTFFESMAKGQNQEQSRYAECIKEYEEVYANIPELPFSNIWLAKQTAPLIPIGARIHFGILNSLRSWDLFYLPEKVYGSSNVGGFGIDGGVSTLIGSSLAKPEILHFGIFGDLAFFYDMNSLGNRHVGHNLRIMLVNNAQGAEFRLYHHPASKLGDDCAHFISAGGHYGKQSQDLVKHYAEDLGFIYLSAKNKEEYLQVVKTFVAPEIGDQPILMEVFTEAQAESNALYAINNIVKSGKQMLKEVVRGVVGNKVASIISKLKS